jgi:hypothetical protein
VTSAQRFIPLSAMTAGPGILFGENAAVADIGLARFIHRAVEATVRQRGGGAVSVASMTRR